MCPRVGLPLLRDSDSSSGSNFVLLFDPAKIVKVWNAVLIKNEENEFQLVFATPLKDK